MLGPMLLTRHNLSYYQDLMRRLRESISEGKLSTFVERFRKFRLEGDLDLLQ